MDDKRQQEMFDVTSEILQLFSAHEFSMQEGFIVLGTVGHAAYNHAIDKFSAEFADQLWEKTFGEKVRQELRKLALGVAPEGADTTLNDPVTIPPTSQENA